MGKYDPATYKYLVTDLRDGRKYKGMSAANAAKRSSLDVYSVTSGTEDYGGVDSDTHNVRVQSYGKKRSEYTGKGPLQAGYKQTFAFRGD